MQTDEALIETKDVMSMPEDIVLSVSGVSKKFCRNLKRSMFYGISDIFTELLGLRSSNRRLRKGEFWALSDITFDLRKGEAIGMVGANGAGKTTLLKIISGLIKPDSGIVKIKGKVAPLIALGAGFNPVLSGRENIFVNMGILGLTKAEIVSRFDEVVAFAEIADAIDAPVQTYSSGMSARLGFACAIHTDPDILIIDEVLAVGDIRFRVKCYKRIEKLRKSGTSFILVSHQTQTINSICQKAIYLKTGKAIALGDSPSVVSRYEKELFGRDSSTTNSFLEIERKSPTESHGIDFLCVYFTGEAERQVEFPETGANVCLNLKCVAHRAIENLDVQIIIRRLDADNETILHFSSESSGFCLDVDEGESIITVFLKQFGLVDGNYTAKISLKKGVLEFFDVIESFKFTVVSSASVKFRSLFHQAHEWDVRRLT
jgi:lipopolysaccharide transport system ATP-binding protein